MERGLKPGESVMLLDDGGPVGWPGWVDGCGLWLLAWAAGVSMPVARSWELVVRCW